MLGTLQPWALGFPTWNLGQILSYFIYFHKFCTTNASGYDIACTLQKKPEVISAIGMRRVWSSWGNLRGEEGGRMRGRMRGRGEGERSKWVHTICGTLAIWQQTRDISQYLVNNTQCTGKLLVNTVVNWYVLSSNDHIEVQQNGLTTCV